MDVLQTNMLEVPETGSGTEKELGVPPCFRCLFEKPISENLCNPETCKMLDLWLTDDNFSWHKYVLSWSLELELKSVKSNGLTEEI